MLKETLMVAAGGAIGALARFGVGLAIARLPGKPMPLGTLAVNVFGCLAIGMAGQYLAAHPSASVAPALRYGLVIGFLGALTTFSAFGWDSVELMQKGHSGLALANIGANVVVGLLAVWVGMSLVGQASRLP
ncbi:MAG TPA: fluoride efflux transporter CrcB [Pirellulaceae bacterium]|nr:fluoride efflux transporter CrcB [Pirellulaceae bacterium]